MKAVAQRAVADLVVVLKADIERARGEARRVGPARLAVVMGRRLAGVEPPLVDRRRDVGRRAGVVAVIRLVVARQVPPDLVVEVVGPDAVEAPAPFRRGAEHLGLVAVIAGIGVSGGTVEQDTSIVEAAMK